MRIQNSAKRLHEVKGCLERQDSHCARMHLETLAVDSQILRIVNIPVPSERVGQIAFPLSFHSAIPPGLLMQAPSLQFMASPERVMQAGPAPQNQHPHNVSIQSTGRANIDLRLQNKSADNFAGIGAQSGASKMKMGDPRDAVEARRVEANPWLY
ncbi:hypothetical protein FGO68_gene9207 [Halteria grandinella]|uniref:Uncharacterized protein n=1 Tax=Halteria grandinella TaxID=5974 RepID=A0A8J8NLZ8_HALGN|nr:hypothetical protein FGO68_gene9207 [Halteria grandinella]